MSAFRTPPELARLWGVKPSKVLGWIATGELEAVDLSTNAGSGRPRWKISEAAIAAFEAKRTAKPPTPRVRRRRSARRVRQYIT